MPTHRPELCAHHARTPVAKLHQTRTHSAKEDWAGSRRHRGHGHGLNGTTEGASLPTRLARYLGQLHTMGSRKTRGESEVSLLVRSIDWTAWT